MSLFSTSSTKRKAPSQSEYDDSALNFATDYTALGSYKKQRTEQAQPQSSKAADFDLDSFLYQSDSSTTTKTRSSKQATAPKPTNTANKTTNSKTTKSKDQRPIKPQSSSSQSSQPAVKPTANGKGGDKTVKVTQQDKKKLYQQKFKDQFSKQSNGIRVKQSLGQRKALEKVEKRNKALRQAEAEKKQIDEVDYLVRDRGEELELNQIVQEKSSRKAEKSEQHSKHINATLQFMLDTFARVKQSKQLIKKGQDPLHEYDHFITYPLDAQAIADKLTKSPEVLAGFEWLHNTRKMVWDLGSKSKEQNPAKENDPLARLLNKKKGNKTSGDGFLKLRPLNNNDLAYMVKQRTKVASLERLLEKENEFNTLKEKTGERQIRNKKMLARTNDGQPIMKHRMKNLLEKIAKKSASM